MQQEDAYFNLADSLLLAAGNPNESLPYQKSTALHTWLFGYEFPDTVFLLTLEQLYVITSQKKGSLLDCLNNKVSEKQIPVTIFKRSKDGSNDDEIFSTVIEIIKKGKRIGLPTKDQFKGKLYDAFMNAIEDIPKVDISVGLSFILAAKDEEALSCIKSASKCSSSLMKEYVIEEIMSIIDEEKNVKHSDLTKKIEDFLFSDKAKKKLGLPSDFDESFLDICYSPIIQSKNFTSKPANVSDDKLMDFNVILCSLGVRYHSYCSNIGRTFLIDPSSSQEKNYQFLLDFQRYVLSLIKEHAIIKDVYLKGVELVKSKRPDLVDYLPKNFGFGIGLEYKESEYLISSKNENELLADMTLNLSVGFYGLENQKYSIALSDTVRVTTTEPLILTEMSKKLRDISFTVKDDAESEKDESVLEISSDDEKENKQIRTRRRRAGDEESPEATRKEHQLELYEIRHKEMLEVFKDGNAGKKADSAATLQKFESYRKDTFLPREIKQLSIFVDKRNESVLFPIYGLAVPFHISTIKNVTKNEEGEFTYLRINLSTPGQAFGKKDNSGFNEPDSHFVRALTYRGTNGAHLSDVMKDIMDLKKFIAKRELEKKEMSDLVEQAKLIEIKGRRPLRLIDVYMRPGFEGKRVPGEIEIHTNGLRYQSQLKSDHRVDILFSNIKHLLFQPCDKEMIVLIHCHLKNPIMIGKKKTKDVQFYREAYENSFDETGAGKKKRSNFADEDELEAEQQERRRISSLNQEFKTFSEKIMEASKLEVDVPFRELSFYGCPSRTNVLLLPTTECLVHLTDTPFFVATLADIEIANLERVVFGLKNFDMVFVFKDHSIPPARINTIPMTSLEHVKEWLDSMDVLYSESKVNYNWNNIMKMINDDPLGFYEQGGWDFMMKAEGSEGEEGGSDDEPTESEFEDDDESGSDDYESSESESVSEVPTDEFTEDEEDEEEDDEEGMDWDELEEAELASTPSYIIIFTVLEEKNREKKRAPSQPAATKTKRSKH